jgi:hypothetical protein
VHVSPPSVHRGDVDWAYAPCARCCLLSISRTPPLLRCRVAAVRGVRSGQTRAYGAAFNTECSPIYAKPLNGISRLLSISVTSQLRSYTVYELITTSVNK